MLLPLLPPWTWCRPHEIQHSIYRARNARRDDEIRSFQLTLLLFIDEIVCALCVRHRRFAEYSVNPCVRCANFSQQCRSEYRTRKCSEAFNLLSPSHRRRQWRRRRPENSNKALSFVVIKTHCIHTYNLDSTYFNDLSIREEIQFSIFASLV